VVARQTENPGLVVPLLGAAVLGLAALCTNRTGEGTVKDKPAPGETPPGAGFKRHSSSLAAVRAADGGRDHGRDATSPWKIPPRCWWDILVRAWREMNEDHLGLISAGIAFYGLLALFPALAVAVALVGLFTQPADIVSVLSDIARYAPRQATEIIIGQFTDIAGSRDAGLGLTALVGIVLALWSASRGMMSLIEGLNVAYDEDEKRGMVRLNLEALGLTVVAIVGVIVGLGAAIGIPAALAVFGSHEVGWLAMLRWPVLVAGVAVGLAVIYRFGPSREDAKWRWLSPGALAGTVLWVAGTAVFSWYASSFASYNETFGTLGGAVVLLMWLWVSAYAVLIGAELNAEIEAQTARDSTTGQELPIGDRGATKADTLGLPASSA
jgi:membrane protein